MRKIFLKRAIVSLLLVSWCIQPVCAIEVNSWNDLSGAVAGTDSQITVNGTINAEPGTITIPSDKNISISGGIIDGNNNHKLFFNYGNLTLNTTIQNAVAGIGSAGSVLQNNGILTIGSDAIIQNNTNNYWGGAIHQEKGTMNVLSGAQFLNNTANPSYGGAINMQAGTLTIADGTASNFTLFQGNSAKSGGAIFNKLNEYQTPGSSSYNPTYGGNTKTVVGDYTQFKNNTAKGGDGGGAIQNQSVLEIHDNVLFEGNTANGGAAISNIAKTASLIDGLQHSNADYLALTIGDNVTFKSNTGDWAGALYSTGGTVNIGSNALFGGDNASEGNKLQGDYGGGAITNVGNSKMTIEAGSSFKNNSAAAGGGIYNAGTLTLGSATFTSNSALYAGNDESKKLGYGGAIHNAGTFIVSGADTLFTFDSNTASHYGGAIYNEVGKTMSLKGNFTNNTAKLGGGAIYNEGILVIQSGSKFTENKAIDDAKLGGAIQSRGESLTIENGVVFEGNEASYGGALFVAGPRDKTAGTITIDGVKFLNNKAISTTNENGYASTAGALYLATPATGAVPAEMTVRNTEFRGNSASSATNDSGGGAVGLFAKSEFISSHFEDNSVIGDGGGGAAFLGAVSSTKFDTVKFIHNTSTSRGGAIAVRDNIQGNNSAAKLDIINSTFERNEAGTKGGALHNHFYNSEGAAGSVLVSASTFKNNSAQEGGAIYNELLANKGDTITNANISIQNSTFTGNTATASGGAIYNAGVASIGGSSAFSGNTASTSGGAIYSTGTLNLDTTQGDITFSNNTANALANDIALAGTSADDRAVMNITGSANSVILDAISGNAFSTINKNSNNTLTLNGDNSAYLGEFNQSLGVTNVASGASFFGGTNNISGGDVNVSGTLGGTNNLTGGSVTLEDGSTLSGATDIKGGSMTLKGGNNNSGAVITFKNSVVRMFRNARAGANDTLVLDTTTKDLALDASIVSEAGSNGTVNKTGANTLNVNTSQNDFTGTFNNNDGSTVIDGAGKKFFGGTNNINKGSLDVKNGAEVVAGSTTTLGSGADSAQLNVTNGSSVNGNLTANNSSVISVNNSSVGGNTALNNTASMNLDNNASVSGTIAMNSGSSVNINSDSSTASASIVNITGAITGSGSITLNDGNLVIGTGKDMSGYTGTFTQENGKTTVKSGSKFFGGTNTVKLGEFVFASDAILTSEVTVEDDAVLTITGSQEKTFNGNTMLVGGNTVGFVINQADFSGEGSSIDTTADNFSGNITFTDGAALGQHADITLTTDGAKSGKITMGEGSVSTAGSKVKLTNATSFDITAANFVLNTDISSDTGVGTVNVTPSVVTLAVNSDNSGFTGVYNQEAGAATVNSGAKFFNGTNNIKAGSVTFLSGSTLNGNNILTNTASMAINGGTLVDSNSIIDLNSTGSSLSYASGTQTIGNEIKGLGKITNSSDLTISNTAKIDDFNGSYTQNAGAKTTINNGASFFKGTNTINGGSVEFKNGSTLRGANTLNGTSSLLVHDGVSATTGSINLNSADSSVTFGDAADTNTALAANLGIALEGVANSNVYKNGQGILNITGDQSAFNGKFKQTAGTTNISNKFFNNAQITSGVLNLINGSDISASTIALGSAADMYILADTTINNAITGSGDIFVGVDSTGTLFNPAVALNADESAFSGNYTQKNGTVNVAKGFFGGTNKIEGGTVNLNTANSSLKGTNTIGGGANNALVKLTNGATVNDAVSVTMAQNGTLEIANSTDTALGIAIKNKNNEGTVSKTGTGSLNINVDQDIYKGTFVQTNGTTNVNGKKFFGWMNNINKGILNVKDGGSLVSGSTTTLGSGSDSAQLNVTNGSALGGNVIANNSSKVNVDNSTLASGSVTTLNNTSEMNLSNGSTVAGNVQMNNNASININKDSASNIEISGNISSGAIANAADQNITLSQGNLTISGDQKGYKGTFTQEGGSTTVVNGGIFFGGDNFIKDGVFNFNQGAKLSSDVNITNKDVEFNIFGSDKVLDGNKLLVNDSYGFLLTDALFSGSDALVKDGTFTGGHITFEKQGGIASGADITLGNGGTFTMSTGSLANSGNLKMDAGSNFEIVSDLTLNTNLSSVNGNNGTVAVKKADSTAAAPNVTIASDNSAYTGVYKQQDGSEVSVSGKFFNGTNTIDNSKLTFVSGSTLNGNNTFLTAAELVINGGAQTSNTSKIILNDNSSMKLQGTDLILNSSVSGNSADADAISNALTGTFTVTGDNSGFTGKYTQTASTTVVDGGKFFGGTNTISGGSVELKNNAVLAGSTTLNNTASMKINNGTSYASNAAVALGAGGSVLELNNTDTANAMDIDGLSITGSQGTVKKTGSGTLNVNNDQTFSGTYNQNGGTVNASGKFFAGRNNINAGTLNMLTGSTLAGTNTIKNSAELVINDGVSAGTSTVTLQDGSILTLNPAQNKQLNLSDYSVSASGTNTVINKKGLGELIVDALNPVTNSYTGKFNQSEGTTTVSDKFFKGLNSISGGIVNMNDGSTLLGTNTISGTGVVNLNGTSVVDSSAAIAVAQGGTLNFAGSQTLAQGITGSGGNYGTINKTGTGSLTINADQSAFKGKFEQTGGTTVVENGKFFGGKNDADGNALNQLKGGSVQLKDNSEISGNLEMAEGTRIDITNNGRDSLDSNNVPTSNTDKTTISGNITSTNQNADDTNNTIISVTGDNTYLLVEGDQSGYKGKYEQDQGATTEVTGTFFGGLNTVYDGNFIFRDSAKLVTNVIIDGEDVKLTLGDGSKGYTIDYNERYGNIVYTDKANELGFILQNVTITGTLYGKDGDPQTKLVNKLTFGDRGGFSQYADYILGQVDPSTGDVQQTAVVNMKDGSVAQDGAKMFINNGSVLNITAAYLNKDAVTDDKLGEFGMDISGDGLIQVNSSGGFTINSNNSAFAGTYNQTNGNIVMQGLSDSDKAMFFNGTNLITGGTVKFAQNSVLMGQNLIGTGAVIELADGSTIDAGTVDKPTVIQTDGGALNITNSSEKVNLNLSVSNTDKGGTINKTGNGELEISADQHGFKGSYNQTAGKTVINAAKTFFGGKNTISGGSVDATAVDADKKGAILAGENTINGTGKIIIGDFTNTSNLTNNLITLDSADAVLELNSTDGNDKNMEIAFAVASGANGNGSILHSGNGALNLYNAGNNNLFENFNGVFNQESTGITNVFGKFFKNSDIKNGILNLKDGAELTAGGTTNIGADGTLNIGTLNNDITVNPVEFKDDSKVTLAGNITGTGKVNITQGETTISSSSDNAGFTGAYTQTGGTVNAQSGSTFFGGTNLISKGKLIFKQGAKLAAGKNVELKGNSDPNAGDITSAVLDLDNRTNAVFNGANLYIDSKDTEGFTFSEGVLVNAMLNNTQNIGGNAFVTLKEGAGIAAGTQMNIADAKVLFGTGSASQEGAAVSLTDASSVLGLVSSNLDWKAQVTGSTGTVSVYKDNRETNAPNINLYGDQSGFTGAYNQDAGTVNVKNDAVFFKGDGSNLIVQGGDLILDKGSLLSGDLNITGSGGASDKHGRVWIADKIYDDNGNELNDISKLMSGDLYYNTKADGSAINKNHITITNAGLILSNGTIFDGSNGVTVFDKAANGVVDIGFSNGTGVNGDIELREDTMLSYGDNAYIKDNSTLIMDDNAILNFINKNSDLTYNPTITGGGAIYKEGLATTNVSSAIDMRGEVKVKEGTLNFTNRDKVSFAKTEPNGGSYGRQTGNLEVGSADSNAIINILAKQTNFGGNVIANAQDGTVSGLNLLGQNTTIGGNLSANNTYMHITGNTSVGGNFLIDGNSALNLIGGSANRIVVNGDMTLGNNLKDGKLPVSFDYDPHNGGMDSIIVNGDFNSSLPLLISGINFVSSPADRVFNLDATTLIQANGPDTPTYDPTSFYANTAMGRYYITNGGGGSAMTGTLTYLNPQMYRGQVATIASWQNQLVVNNMLFNHMDILTRQLMDEQKTANKYAAAYPQFAPYQYDLKGGSLWYKAYGNFETLSMTKGLNVKNNAYGSLIGADFPLIKLKNGWSLVPTAYIGYNGAHQTFDGVSMYQNGAQIGFMGTAYKDNLITSLLAYGGGYANDMSVRGGAFGSGSDTTGNWFAGVASKTAYNIKLPKDFIFQPTFLASYNAFGNQNWGSNFGVLSMNSGMLNGINVAPGFNLIWQKKTFNIYATAQMVYNIMGVVDGRAGNVDLGNVRMRHSYFEYGLGVSKSFKERFMGYLQFTIRNGGRTGIGFQGGLQWKIGK